LSDEPISLLRAGRARAERAGERKSEILAVAARLFAERGFDSASMREIAAALGLKAGSLYHHFASKEELFVAVYGAAIAEVSRYVRAAIAKRRDPWDRLEAAAAAHCEALVATDEAVVAVLAVEFIKVSGPVREHLVRQRDDYECIFRDLIADVKLRADIDPDVLRLHILGAMNLVRYWYRPGSRLTPAQIGAQLIRTIRGGGA